MFELLQPSCRVFLAEDSADDETLTVRALRALNPAVEVHVRRDGQQASEYLQGLSDLLPRLILLDLKLPKMTGIELIKVVRESAVLRFTPVIMLTSSDEPRDVVDSYRAGATGFVRKPVDYDQYVTAVKALGRFWLEFNLCSPLAR